MKIVKVPEPFLLAPFFSEDEEVKTQLSVPFEKMIEIEPLIFDLYHYLEVDDLKPWQEKHKYIPKLLEQWQTTEPIIMKHFQVRDRARALLPMKQMIKLFIAFLFWTNTQPVPRLKNIINFIHELKIKPVNVEERISYILSAPNHHHAFTQLKQLFSEQQKKYAVSKIIK